MKKLLIITSFLAATVSFISCGGAHGNDPGDIYMPDMTYSRAYETYGYNNVHGEYDTLKARRIHYTATPVSGTIARGDMASNTTISGDSGYVKSTSVANPLASINLSPTQMKEAERIYLVNCAICHGSKLDGNGPLWKGGDGPYPAAPRNLLDDYSKALADGQMYQVITHGKGLMGSYASQLHPEQRWWVVNYIRSKQNGDDKGSKAATASTDSTKATN